MADRRSIGSAMTMTPEKLAFIKGNAAKEKSVVREPLREEPKSDQSPEPAPEVDAKLRPRRQGRVRNERAPEASEVIDQLLVPVTFRLPHRVAQALRRAHLVQRLNHAKPDTQQEIVDEALTAWLTKNGYLE